MSMTVSNVDLTQSALAGLESAQPAMMKLQAMLLRKAMDAQQDQANEIMKMMDGKGTVVDIRV